MTHSGEPARVGQLGCARVLREGGTHLPEHQLPIHVHGQVPKVQQHLVGGQLLLNDVIPVDGHDGYADEEVEVVRLGKRGFQPRPHPAPVPGPQFGVCGLNKTSSCFGASCFVLRGSEGLLSQIQGE